MVNGYIHASGSTKLIITVSGSIPLVLFYSDKPEKTSEKINNGQ